MTLQELMSEIGTPDPNWTGEVMADDNILAINTTPSDDSVSPSQYCVVMEHITGLDPQLNAETSDKQYMRQGKSSSKTAVQRTFSVTGDKYIGDPAMDFLLSIEMCNSIGQDAITDYVFINAHTGKGERGKVVVVVNSDGGGTAGENAGIDINLNKTGGAPEEYTYA